MITFRKGNDQVSPFRLDFSKFLANEGKGITITEIDLRKISGDAELGVGSRAPSLTDGGTSVLFWVGGGTAETSTLFELIYTTSTGSIFDARVQFCVEESLQ